MSDRYAQCDDTCTVDCGACKGAGRPMTAASDADRAKAAEVIDAWDADDHGTYADLAARFAAALAAERADECQRWTTALHALAEELEVTASRYEHAVAGSHDAGARNAHRIIAARLRAVVADTGKPHTSSEEEQA